MCFINLLLHCKGELLAMRALKVRVLNNSDRSVSDPLEVPEMTIEEEGVLLGKPGVGGRGTLPGPLTLPRTMSNTVTMIVNENLPAGVIYELHFYLYTSI